MPIPNSMLDSVLEFTRALDLFTLSAFTLITIIAMVCWALSTTDSDDRAELVRAFTELIQAFFNGVKSLLSGWGNDPGEEPPGLTA